MILANKDCPLGEETNLWVFALLRYWLKAVFVPINRRFSVLQSVLQSCNARLSSYFKAHPQLTVENTKETKLKLIKAVTRRQEGMRFAQTSVDASGLLLARPNSFQPAIDIIRDSSYTIYMDVPGLTKKDLQLSRQNITTIVKGFRSTPYHELQSKVEKCERKYGDLHAGVQDPAGVRAQVALVHDRERRDEDRLPPGPGRGGAPAPGCRAPRPAPQRARRAGRAGGGRRVVRTLQ